jgi:glutathione S-transferase
MNTGQLGAGQCAVAALLDFLNVTGITWRGYQLGKRQQLQEWFSRINKRPSFLRTHHLRDWKTGKTVDPPEDVEHRKAVGSMQGIDF